MLTEKKARPIGKLPQLPGFSASHGSSWKVAYADFVTAMMAFFLLMWVVGMVPDGTRKQLEQYFKDAPPAPSGGLVAPGTAASAPPSADEIMRYAIALRFKKIITEDPYLKGASGLGGDDVGVLLRLHNAVFFRPGTAELTEEAKRLLADVVDVLRTYNVYLVIRGHAAMDEAVGSTFASNWELSGARAAAAASWIIRQGGITPSRLRAVAYGDARPLVPELSPEAAAANRRVEFYFHRPEAAVSNPLY